MSRSNENTPTAVTQALVWIDLEMTGLNPNQDKILEIATIVTDAQLETLIEGPSIVIYWPDEVLGRMGPVVREMHEKNGLTERVRAATTRMSAAETETLQFVKAHCEPGTSPLCGNSVWMDRLFLRQQMPQLEQFLHHRVVDVSTLKELARRWHPELAHRAPAKPDTHRALDDIRASIEELRYYRQHWIREPEAPYRSMPD